MILVTGDRSELGDCVQPVGRVEGLVVVNRTWIKVSPDGRCLLETSFSLDSWSDVLSVTDVCLAGFHMIQG